VYLWLMIDLTDLGYIIEGVVEQDPMDEKYRVRTIDKEGNQILVDPQELLTKYNGQEVKLTVASMEVIRQIQEVLEAGGDAVSAVMPEDIPGAKVTTTRKPD